MRILLDECVNAGVRKALPGHVVRTVTEMGLRGISDRALLELAQSQFDVFVTIDKNLEGQNDLATFKLGFVMVRVRNNEIASYEPLFKKLKEAAEKVRPGEILIVKTQD